MLHNPLVPDLVRDRRLFAFSFATAPPWFHLQVVQHLMKQALLCYKGIEAKVVHGKFTLQDSNSSGGQDLDIPKYMVWPSLTMTAVSLEGLTNC